MKNGMWIEVTTQSSSEAQCQQTLKSCGSELCLGCCGWHVSSTSHGLVCRCFEDLDEPELVYPKCSKSSGLCALWIYRGVCHHISNYFKTSVGFCLGMCVICFPFFVVMMGRTWWCCQSLLDSALFTSGYWLTCFRLYFRAAEAITGRITLRILSNKGVLSHPGQVKANTQVQNVQRLTINNAYLEHTNTVNYRSVATCTNVSFKGPTHQVSIQVSHFYFDFTFK